MPLTSYDPAADPRDVESIEAIVGALYETISGPAGGRDWDRFRTLFLPEARLIPTGDGEGGAPRAVTYDVESYIERAGQYFAERGFYERGIAARVDRFGHIAHVFSTYEARHREDDAEPFARGINSIQLFHDGTRWWVVTIFWDVENEAQAIPPDYLPAD